MLHGDPLADGSASDSGRAIFRTVLPDEPPAYNQLDSGTNVSLPTNAGDRWGFDVAATGDTYVIGGPGNDAAGTDAGEVRIGSFSDPGFEAVLSPDPSFDPARLGTAVVVDGDRMVASAPFTSAGASGAGLVYVYERANASSPWELATSIASPDPEFDGGFGDSLDLRGPLLAIGESDRFGDGAEPGRVWAYAFTGSSWELQGPALAPAIVGAENGDQFGASLAWIDETVLAIGAPGTAGSTGRVALVTDTGAGWNITEVTTPEDVPGFSGVEPVAGDQFGFDVAAGSGVLSGTNLIVGAPGRDDGGAEGGAVYLFGVVEGVATFTNSFGYAAGERVGTAVDTSGDRAVAAGYGGGTLSVQILEYIPNPDIATEPDREFVWNGDGGASVGVGFIPEDGPINDYLALDGTTIAVGRPGGGGSVAVFQRGASGWPTVPDIEIVPAGRWPGDRIGHAIALDGTVLVIGAPGDNGVTFEFPNSGAVYSTDLSGVVDPCDTTFTGLGGDALWGNTANWSDGVPTATSAACFEPGGVVVAAGTTAEALRLEGDVPLVTIEGSLTLSEDSEFTNGFRLDTTGSLNGAGEITVGSGNTMNVSGLVTAPLRNKSDTFLDIRTGTRFSGAQVTNDGQVLVDGDGFSLENGATIVNNSQFVFFNGGSAPLTQTVTTSGAPSSFVNGSQVSVNAGVTAVWPAGLQVDFDEPSSILELDIGGTPASGNFGRLVLDGNTLTLGANTVLNVRNLPGVDAPTVFDRYNVLDCGAVDCPLFPNTFLEPGVEQFLVGGDIVLGLVSVQNTFVNETSGAAWNVDANWSNGVVPGPGEVAVVPDGTTPTIADETDVVIDRLELDGELAIDGSLTLDSVTVGPEGILRVRNDGVLSATGDIEVQDGGQMSVFESTVDGIDDGTVDLDPGPGPGPGPRMFGDGLVANSGVLRTNGPVTIGSGLTWNSGRNSLVDVQSGILNVGTTNFEDEGGFSVAPGAADRSRRQHDPAAVVVDQGRRCERWNFRNDQHPAARLRSVPRRRSRPDVRTHRARRRRGLHRCRTDHDLHLQRLLREPARPGQGRRVR